MGESSIDSTSASALAAAEHLGVSRVTLSRVLNGVAGISADLALRLSEALGMSPDLWMGIRAGYCARLT